MTSKDSLVTWLKENAVAEIGNYSILKHLGEGTFGVVKLGEHKITKQKVALKLLPSRTNAAEREIKALQHTNHPHIVKLIEVIELGGVWGPICLVMEYASDGELFEYVVNNGKVAEAKAAHFIRQTLLALEHCHSKGIIHRDLKPENILLDADNVKLCDFGHSVFMTPGSLMEGMCGSLDYTAPEILQHKKYLGPEIDVFALGAILYTMVTGCMPWPGKDADGRVANIIVGRYFKPKNVSKQCSDLIRRMLAVDVRQRITINELMADPWVTQGAIPVKKEKVPLLPKDLEDDLLDEISELGFAKMAVVKDLVRGDLNEPSSSYYHLLSTIKHGVPPGKNPEASLAGISPPGSPIMPSPLAGNGAIPRLQDNDEMEGEQPIPITRTKLVEKILGVIRRRSRSNSGNQLNTAIAQPAQ